MTDRFELDRAQVYRLDTDQWCPGHQAGVLMHPMGRSFVATHRHMRAMIDCSASIMGGSRCCITFHVGIAPGSPGDRISGDDVDQGPLAGVTDYRESIFVGGMRQEALPANMMVAFDMVDLEVGETYTWEAKWGFVSGAKNATLGALPLRVAVDDLGVRAVATNLNGNSVSIFSIGGWPFWISAPGVFTMTGTPAGYEPTERWLMSIHATTALPVGSAPFGVDTATQTAGRRAVVSCVGTNHVHLINMLTGAIARSTTVALAADAYDIVFYPGAAPTKAVCATVDGQLRILDVSDTAITLTSSINAGVVGKTTAANLYTGSTVGLWHGQASGGNAVLRGFTVAGAPINGAGLTLQTSADISRIRRIKPGDIEPNPFVTTPNANAETLLVATTKGKVFHVSKDGGTILGSWTHPLGTTIPINDVDATLNGRIAYAVDGQTTGHICYFWLPNAGNNVPAYLHFDDSAVSPTPGTSALGVALTQNEDVIITRNVGAVGSVLSLPGGLAQMLVATPPYSILNAEHFAVTFEAA